MRLWICILLNCNGQHTEHQHGRQPVWSTSYPVKIESSFISLLTVRTWSWPSTLTTWSLQKGSFKFKRSWSSISSSSEKNIGSESQVPFVEGALSLRVGVGLMKSVKNRENSFQLERPFCSLDNHIEFYVLFSILTSRDAMKIIFGVLFINICMERPYVYPNTKVSQ